MRGYKANMIPGGATPTINVSQYDNDYAVTVTLIEGAEIYTPPVGATIRVEGTKPDGHGFEYPCTYQGNVVTMPIYTQMTVVSGRFLIELVVYQSGLRVGSCNIIFAVERAPLGEDTDISETVIPDIIAGAQAQANAAAASATTASSAATNAVSARNAAIEAAETATEAAAQVLSSQIVTDASGTIASFSDGADDVAVKSLVASITPVQNGSGDPSPTNVRPISGRTGMTVTRCGRNLGKITLNSIADADIGEGSYTLAGLTFSFTKVSDNGVSEIVVNGTPTARATSTLNRNLLAVMPPGRYILSGCPSGGALNKYRLTCWDSTVSATVASDVGSGATFELVEGHIVNFAIDISASMAGETISNLVFKPMIRPASDSNDAYEPYNGTSFPITWETEAGTVYGGTLDAVSGVLTVGWRYVTFSANTMQLNGPLSGYSRVYVYRNLTLGGLIVPNETDDITEAVCNILPSISRTQASVSANNGIFQYHSGSDNELRLLFPREDAYNTNEKIYALGVACAIPLKETTTYQLTPTEVRTLLGGNNIYTDAGDVSVEYIADTKLYIDKRIAELQALVLEN